MIKGLFITIFTAQLFVSVATMPASAAGSGRSNKIKREKTKALDDREPSKQKKKKRNGSRKKGLALKQDASELDVEGCRNRVEELLTAVKNEVENNAGFDAINLKDLDSFEMNFSELQEVFSGGEVDFAFRVIHDLKPGAVVTINGLTQEQANNMVLMVRANYFVRPHSKAVLDVKLGFSESLPQEAVVTITKI